jgi:hypothetical protein
VLRLVLLSVLVGTSVWFEQSTFVPFATDRAISYALCTPAVWQLLGDILFVAAILGGVSLALEQTLLIETYSDRLRFGSSELFTPLALVAANLLSAGLLSASLRERWSAVAYVSSSLYPFLWAAAAVLVVRNVYAAGRAPLRQSLTSRWLTLDAARQSLLLDVAIAATVAGIVIASSPKIRFSGIPVGDEPKYLRYAENWWQGRGMDMDGVQDASDIPAAKQGPKLLRNFSNLLPALERDVSQLAADASYLGNSKHWGHQFNKATYVGNWFVTGKNGGLYQMHQPGVSIVMLPAYLIDRWLFDRGRGRFADDLFTVNLVMLLIWVVAAALTARLLEQTTADRGVAFAVTLGLFASVPLATFAFPFYPETLGAVLVGVTTRRIITGEPLSGRAAALAGAAIGWLVWLHVRFVVVAFALFLWMLWTYRRNNRSLTMLTVACGVVTGAFCLYAYHVTGSLLPTAFYDAGSPDAGFRSSRLPVALLGVLFDRENGLLALAPVYVLALPGIGLMLRTQRRTAAVVVSLIGALIVTVAGHGYESSGTSPLRYVVAVLPLAAVPIAVWVRAMRGRTLALGFAAALTLTSMQMAAAYNLRNDKTITQTIAAGVSGWDPSFMFPLLRRTEQPGFDARSLAAWETLSVVVVATGFWFGSRRTAAAGSPRIQPAAALAVSLAIVGLAGGLAVYAGGPRRELRLLKTPQESLRECRANCGTQPRSLQIGTIPPDR